MVLEGQQLSLELEVPGEAGHCYARAGVAVPPDEGVVGGRLADDVAEDVVHHLRPGLRLHLDLPLLSRGAEGRGCGVGGGGQSGQPLAVPTHAHLVVGRTEGGGYVGLSGVVVNAGHAPHHVTPDVGAVAGEEASHQTKVLCALKQYDEAVVKPSAAASASEFLEEKNNEIQFLKVVDNSPQGS